MVGREPSSVGEEDMAGRKAKLSIAVFALVFLVIPAGCARGRAAGPEAAGTEPSAAQEKAAVCTPAATEAKQGTAVCPAGAIKVAEAVICADVQNREPVGAASSFPADVKKVCCWSKIANGQRQTIKHVYYYENNEEAAVALAIGSPLWRTHSSKTIRPGDTGQWRVDIVDADGNVLKSLSFTVGL
ncbi:MAG: DUF2914 domain-containing protein [Candidatus Abyssobacteria bacterium SURF_17]|uniref:DUF2914 domain-containing protein n=1 Tax=Candidatus Abyssobacteria bacterium SURF_17 TaxID=2093361 RepID=A0A419EUS1_9BACT|nr:MAG: DUF2914 domain-containing protein [Candidatus Abyssubacteria bacterium SURF_17]